MSVCIKQVSSFFALARAEESKILESEKRPVWLSFNLDRSGSMDETITGSNHTRWDFVSRCVETLVYFRKQNGHPDDLVSVVVYNHSAEVLVPPQRISGCTMDVLKGVKPEGSTSIYSGYVRAHELHQEVGKQVLLPKPSLIVNVDLTDGYANYDCTDAESLAKVKREHFEVTDYCTNIVLATYAVSSCSDDNVPRVACSLVGSSRSIFRKLNDREFNEFQKECAVIASLCDNVVTSISPGGSKCYLVRGAPWSIVQTMKFKGITEPPVLDQLLHELVSEQSVSPEFTMFMKILNGEQKEPVKEDDIPSDLLPLSMMDLRVPRRQQERKKIQLPEDFEQQVERLKKNLQTDDILDEFLSVVNELVKSCSSIPSELTLMRGMSSQSQRCQNVYNNYRQYSESTDLL